MGLSLALFFSLSVSQEVVETALRFFCVFVSDNYIDIAPLRFSLF